MKIVANYPLIGSSQFAAVIGLVVHASTTLSMTYRTQRDILWPMSLVNGESVDDRFGQGVLFDTATYSRVADAQ